MRKWLIGLAVVLGMIWVVSPAQATILSPGGFVAADPTTFVPAGSILEATTGPLAVSFSDNTGFTQEWVYLDAVTGNMDFVYGVTLAVGSTGIVEHLAASSYAGFTTDVGYDPTTPPGGLPPNDTDPTHAVTRSPGIGAVVTFNFTSLPLTDGFNSSALLVVKTNAPNFQGGTFSLQEGGSQEFDGFAPGPEPSSLILLCTGIVGIGGYAWRRRKLAIA